MSILFDSKGREIRLVRQLGKGGEGSVHEISETKERVAKVYNASITTHKADKLRWMAENGSDLLLKFSAWVVDTLHNVPNGKMVGFLMPSATGKDVHELYSPKSRRVHFPEANWKFLIRTATNLSVAFRAMHMSGHLIGDVNHGNCVVSLDGTVKLIDCDSFSIRANGRLYSTEVGTSEYIPPELQGVNLRGVERTEAHDNFGLAVVIFQLLFLGRHPFVGRPHVITNGTLQADIKEHRFAYGQDARQRGVDPPPGTLPLEAVSQPIADLFRRAFLSKSNRPTAEQWQAALMKLEKELKNCNKHPGHHYFKELGSCPWCPIEAAAGVPLFPIDFGQFRDRGFNILTIEQIVNSLNPPAPLGRPPKVPDNLPTPLVAPPKSTPKERGTYLLLLVGLAVLLIPSVILCSSIGAIIIALFFSFRVQQHFTSSRPDFQDAKQEADKLDAGWKALLTRWSTGIDASVAQNAKQAILNNIARYKRLDVLKQEKIRRLEQNKRAAQLEAFLDRFRIENDTISHIGPERKIVLQSYGIETAADIDPNVIIMIPGFGPAYTNRLVAWRNGLAARFVYDPTKGVLPADLLRIEQETQLAKMRLEKQLQDSVAQLKHQFQLLHERRKNIKEHASALASRVAEARAKRDALATSPLSSVPFYVLAVAGPVVMQIVFLNAFTGGFPLLDLLPEKSQVAQPSNSSGADNAKLATVNTNLAIASNSNTSNSTNTANNADSTLDQMETIDDMSVTLMPPPERAALAKKAFESGVKNTRSKRFEVAERFFAQAVRFEPSSSKHHHELGYARFRLEKYNDGLVSLLEARKLAARKNNETEKLIGQTYLALANWNEANMIFDDLVQEMPNEFIVHYGLGVSSRHLGKRAVAIVALNQAVRLKPDSDLARYELAVAHIDIGDYPTAREHYEHLSRKNSKLAIKLGPLIK